LALELSSGRARDQRTGGFVEVGKTFKGLTDDDFREMTDSADHAQDHRTSRGPWWCGPEVVV